MKRTLFFIAAICLFFAACDPKAPKTETSQSDEPTTTVTEEPQTTSDAKAFSVNTINITVNKDLTEEQIQESFPEREYYDDFVNTFGAGATLKVDIDFPVTDNQNLKNGIVSSIVRSVGVSEFDDPNALVEEIKYQFLTDRSAMYATTISCKCVDETDKYVTYVNLHDEEYFETENVYSFIHETFDKENGTTFNIDYFDSKEEVAKLLFYQLAQKPEADMELEDYYGGIFDLADYEIWVQDGKLKACYYGEWMVYTEELSYEQVKPYLTEEGRSFFE